MRRGADLVLRRAQDEVDGERPRGSLILSPSKDEASGTDTFTPTQRSAVMRRVKSANTKPELVVRRLLHGLGGRYRLHIRELPGSPDLVFPGRRLVVFVHGCFWHGHGCARGARTPKANAAYWTAKLDRNRTRDAQVRAKLQAAGWRVETIWECELRELPVLEQRLRRLLETAPLQPRRRPPRSG